MMFEENYPAWKTRSGSLMDEKAVEIQRHRQSDAAKRNSDTTLQHKENVNNLGPTEAKPTVDGTTRV